MPHRLARRAQRRRIGLSTTSANGERHRSGIELHDAAPQAARADQLAELRIDEGRD
jgi:hypothetical protein